MVEYSKVNVKLSDTGLKNWKLLLKIMQEQLWEWVLKCLMGMICFMNYYWHQDEKQSQKMSLTTICELI